LLPLARVVKPMQPTLCTRIRGDDGRTTSGSIQQRFQVIQ
jgi:hypothetical protein